jgi:hypothetical protein
LMEFRRRRAPSLRSGLQKNRSLIPSLVIYRNLYIPLFSEPLKLFSPLDQQDALRRHQIVERQRIEFALGIDAIKINVVERHRRAAVFMDKRKRRAGYVIGFRRLKAFDNAFDHGGLPGSQIAAQKNDAAGLELSGKSTAEFRSLFGGMGLKSFHR